MKALSLTQPWATLIAIGAKRIETRTWSTDYRGPLAIHAAKGLGGLGDVPSGTGGSEHRLALLCWARPFSDALTAAGIKAVSDLPRGCVAALCQLVSVIETRQLLANPVYEWDGPDGRHYRYELTDQERAFGGYAPGRYAWLLEDIQRLPGPIPAKGRLGLWDWEAEHA